MPEEAKKEAEGLSKGLSQGLIWAIIGAIIGVLLSIFAIIDAGFAGMPALFVLALGGAIFGFCLGFIYGIFPKNMKIVALFLVIIIIGLIIYWFIVSAKFGTGPFGPYLSSVSIRVDSIGKTFSSFKSYGYCLSNDPRCPFISMWEQPKIQNSQEATQIAIEFSNKKIIDGEIDLLVS